MNSHAAFETHPIQKVGCTRSITLGMAELQPDGISEQWFLKLGGDIHWSLIAQAMGQKQAVFEDIYRRGLCCVLCDVDRAFSTSQIACERCADHLQPLSSQPSPDRFGSQDLVGG